MAEFVTISLADLKKSGATYHHEMLRNALSNAGCEMVKMQESLFGFHYDREEKWDLNKVPIFTEDALLFLKPHMNACELFETKSRVKFDEKLVGKGISFLQFIDWVDYTYAEKFGQRPPTE